MTPFFVGISYLGTLHVPLYIPLLVRITSLAWVRTFERNLRTQHSIASKANWMFHLDPLEISRNGAPSSNNLSSPVKRAQNLGGNLQGTLGRLLPCIFPPLYGVYTRWPSTVRSIWFPGALPTAPAVIFHFTEPGAMQSLAAAENAVTYFPVLLLCRLWNAPYHAKACHCKSARIERRLEWTLETTPSTSKFVFNVHN